jgi:hypothetical protein
MRCARRAMIGEQDGGGFFALSLPDARKRGDKRLGWAGRLVSVGCGPQKRGCAAREAAAISAASRFIVLVVLAVLAACTDSSQVQRLSSNTYTISTHILGASFSSEDAKAQDEEIAAGKCAATDRKVTILRRDGYDGIAAQDRLTFRCDLPVAQPKQGS